MMCPFTYIQNELLPASDRLPAHTKKKPSGPFDRKKLLQHLQEQAENSTVGQDYVPFVKKQPPKEQKVVSEFLPPPLPSPLSHSLSSSSSAMFSSFTYYILLHLLFLLLLLTSPSFSIIPTLIHLLVSSFLHVLLLYSISPFTDTPSPHPRAFHTSSNTLLSLLYGLPPPPTTVLTIQYYTLPGVHNTKAEECTTPYMRQNIKINIGVGGLRTWQPVC